MGPDTLKFAIEQFNPAQVIVIAFIIWFFYSRIDKRFDKIDQRFEKIDQQFQKVDNDIKELRTSLNRMEGAFYSKECCMLKDEKHDKKAL